MKTIKQSIRPEKELQGVGGIYLKKPAWRAS